MVFNEQINLSMRAKYYGNPELGYTSKELGTPIVLKGPLSYPNLMKKLWLRTRSLMNHYYSLSLMINGMEMLYFISKLNVFSLNYLKMNINVYASRLGTMSLSQISFIVADLIWYFVDV